MEPEKKHRRGCLFYGCLGTFVLLLVAVLAGYLGFRAAVERFTDSKPLPLPETRLSAAEMQQLQERIANFSRAVNEHKYTDPLTLTADDVNALIQKDPDWAFLKNELYITFEGNRVQARISVPAEKLGSQRLRGRYLNATGTFAVSLRDGVLQVNAEALAAKGRPVPENFMRHIRGRNFALGFTNSESNAALDKLRDIAIQDGKLVIVPK